MGYQLGNRSGLQNALDRRRTHHLCKPSLPFLYSLAYCLFAPLATFTPSLFLFTAYSLRRAHSHLFPAPTKLAACPVAVMLKVGFCYCNRQIHYPR